MRRAWRSLAIAAALCAAMAGCTRTPDCLEDPQATECLAAAKAAAGPAVPVAGTAMATVAFDIASFDAPGLLRDEEGRRSLVLRAAEAEEAIRLPLSADPAQRYALPPGRYEILGLGAEMLCRGASFTVAPGEGTTVLMTLQGIASGAEVTIVEARSGLDGPAAPRVATCLSETAWLSHDDPWDRVHWTTIVIGTAVLATVFALSGDSIIFVSGF
ncbi:MAG: hypothetical protein AAFP23_10570 [Pseudomonadota bacterium]